MCIHENGEEKSCIQSYYTLKHMQVGVNKDAYIRRLHKGKRRMVFELMFRVEFTSAYLF